MIKFEHFTPYTPSKADAEKSELVMLGIGFLKSVDGTDWYDSQRVFSANTTKVMYDSRGIICAVTEDITSLFPNGYSVAEVATSSVPEDAALAEKWVFDGIRIVERSYSNSELVEQAEEKKKQLISDAMNTVSVWQTEQSLGVIDDTDKAALIAWLKYIKALKAIETSVLTEIVWPEQPSTS